MKYVQTLLAGMAIAMSAPQIVSAQKSGFSYNYYGFVRNDIFLSKRQSQTNTSPSALALNFFR
ncbi:MAG: hypothetical protein IJ628_00420 [Bacteroidaceae bacterium]|nr:hypothetical protein [Bacteroidaceae bacterium]MBR1541061.1 hypothetical protein [Bacteroidaceae bacterium]